MPAGGCEVGQRAASKPMYPPSIHLLRWLAMQPLLPLVGGRGRRLRERDCSGCARAWVVRAGHPSGPATQRAHATAVRRGRGLSRTGAPNINWHHVLLGTASWGAVAVGCDGSRDSRVAAGRARPRASWLASGRPGHAGAGAPGTQSIPGSIAGQGRAVFFAWLTSHGSSNQELRQPGRGRGCAASWAMAGRLSSVKPVLEAQPASATTQCIHAIHASTPGGQTAPCGPTRCQHTTAEHADKRYIDGAEPFRPRVTCCTPRTPLPKSPVKRTFPHLSRSSSREAPLSRRRVERERQRPSPGRIQPRQRLPARSLASRGRTGQPQGKMGGGWLLLACRHAESLTPHPSATQAVCCPTAGTWNGVSQAGARYC